MRRQGPGLMRFFHMAVMAAALAVALLIATPSDVEARIKCNGPFQIVRGAGEIATPYCEDEYLAEVARSYGMRVSGRAIRQNPSRKEEVCRTIGHDSRVYDICLNYRDDGRDRFYD